MQLVSATCHEYLKLACKICNGANCVFEVRYFSTMIWTRVFYSTLLKFVPELAIQVLENHIHFGYVERVEIRDTKFGKPLVNCVYQYIFHTAYQSHIFLFGLKYPSQCCHLPILFSVYLSHASDLVQVFFYLSSCELTFDFLTLMAADSCCTGLILSTNPSLILTLCSPLALQFP